MHRNGTGDRFDNRRKLNEDAVAGGLNEAALVLGDCGIDQFTAQFPHPVQCASLILAHEPAVSHDIGRKNSGEPALDPIRRSSLHGGPSSRRSLHLGVRPCTIGERRSSTQPRRCSVAQQGRLKEAEVHLTNAQRLAPPNDPRPAQALERLRLKKG